MPCSRTVVDAMGLERLPLGLKQVGSQFFGRGQLDMLRGI